MAREVVGTDWTKSEIDLVVTDYFDMLAMEYEGNKFIRAERARVLQGLTGRSKGSIEFKRQNISAVLDCLGLPWLTGYLPRANFQGALLDAIEAVLSDRREIIESAELSPEEGLYEGQEIFYGAVPLSQPAAEVENQKLQSLIKKFDPAARDEKNRTLGKRGELLVYESEKTRVSRFAPKLVEKIRWVSDIDGDGAGYDILSFDKDGHEHFIEVKTTVGGQLTPFFISSNELAVSRKFGDRFSLVRLYNFTRSPKAFELFPPLENSLLLRPNSFIASFN